MALCLGPGPTRGGKYDHGEEISLPEGKNPSSKQFEEIAAAIRERQAVVVAMLEEESARQGACHSKQKA